MHTKHKASLTNNPPQTIHFPQSKSHFHLLPPKSFLPSNKFPHKSTPMKRQASFQNLDLNFEATELRLGRLPQTEQEESQSESKSKSGSDYSTISSSSSDVGDYSDELLQIDYRPPTKTQVVGWPPVRSYRKNVIIETEKKKEKEINNGMYVKVSLDGAPYLRKIDLKLYQSYQQFLDALENMFSFKLGRYTEREGYNGCDYVPTYEDKDGDWMMVGDVPWNMFISGCKRLRMMKGSDARGLCCL